MPFISSRVSTVMTASQRSSVNGKLGRASRHSPLHLYHVYVKYEEVDKWGWNGSNF